MPAVRELYTAVIGSSSTHTWSGMCLRAVCLTLLSLHHTHLMDCVCKGDPAEAPGLAYTQQIPQTLRSEEGILLQHFKLEPGQTSEYRNCCMWSFSYSDHCYLFSFNSSGFSWLVEIIFTGLRVPLTDHNSWHGNHVSRPRCQGSGDCWRHGDAG